MNRQWWPIGGKYDQNLVDHSFENLLLHVSFVFGLIPKYVTSTSLPDWSLSLEMQFYLAFPLLAVLAGRMGVSRMALIVGTLALVAGAAYRTLVWFPEPSLLLFKLQYFLAGMLLLHALNESDIAKRYGMIALALCAVSLESKYGRQQFLATFLFLAMLALGAMELAQRTPRAVAAVVDSHIVRFASDTSYSVYLFHGMFIGLFGLVIVNTPYLLTASFAVRTTWMFLFTVAGAYTVGALVFRWVELPGIAFGRKVMYRMLQRGQPVTT